VDRRKPFGIYFRSSKGRLTFVALIDALDQADALAKAKGPVPESYHDRLAVIPWEGPRPRSSRDRNIFVSEEAGEQQLQHATKSEV
jgi:hypothetical protein